MATKQKAPLRDGKATSAQHPRTEAGCRKVLFHLLEIGLVVIAVVMGTTKADESCRAEKVERHTHTDEQ